MPLGPNAEQFRKQLIANAATKNHEADSAPQEFNIHELRNTIENLYTDWLSPVKIDESIHIQMETHTFNGRKVKAIIYRPCTTQEPTAAIIFHPGGGLALDMAHHHKYICAEMAASSGATVICIQPELSPENKLPEILNDAYAATKHFYQNADEYKLCQEKFILSGYSMGGLLALLITLRSSKDEDLNVLGQIIISGVFDIGNPPLESGQDFMFSPEGHLKFVEMCLPEKTTISDIKEDPKYNPFLQLDTLSKLPSTQLIAGECDAFKVDSQLLYEVLQRIGTKVTLTIIPGQIHNTLLLYPIMGDYDDPAKVAGAICLDLY